MWQSQNSWNQPVSPVNLPFGSCVSGERSDCSASAANLPLHTALFLHNCENTAPFQRTSIPSRYSYKCVRWAIIAALIDRWRGELNADTDVYRKFKNSRPVCVVERLAANNWHIKRTPIVQVGALYACCDVFSFSAVRRCAAERFYRQDDFVLEYRYLFN